MTMKFHPSSFQNTLMTSNDEKDNSMDALLNFILNSGKDERYEDTGDDTPLTLQINSSGNSSTMHQHYERFVRASSPLPIPSSKTIIDYELSHEVEEKMKYEQATWLMYHRITSARRRRHRMSPERKAMSPSKSTRTNLPSFPQLPNSIEEPTTDSGPEAQKDIFPIEIWLILKPVWTQRTMPSKIFRASS